MRNIKNYIYIDEQGIDSIYSQLHDETVDKMTVKQTKSKAASIGITAGLSKFKQLFTADASANGELSKSTQYEKSVSLTYEQKITRIIDTVSKYDNYYNDLNVATNSKNLANGITFVNISDTFFHGSTSLHMRCLNIYRKAVILNSKRVICQYHPIQKLHIMFHMIHITITIVIIRIVAIELYYL